MNRLADHNHGSNRKDQEGEVIFHNQRSYEKKVKHALYIWGRKVKIQLCDSESISRTDDDMLMFIWPKRRGRLGNSHCFPIYKTLIYPTYTNKNQLNYSTKD